MRLENRGQGRKAMFAVCGPLWRVLHAGGRFTPPPPLRPAVPGGRGRCGRFLFHFQGAYINGAAIDSPGADG